MRPNLLPLVILLLLLLPTMAAQSEKSSAATNNPDYSREAVVFERLATHATFQADGTGVRETSAAIHMQAEAGVRAFAVLAFAYTSANETVDIDYVRVRKPDGTLVPTPAANILDMPADITRVAPVYSDIHEKHVTVKALSVGDVLEYLVRYRTIQPQVPRQFWFSYAFTKNLIVKDEELQITVPGDKYVKVSSPDVKPEVKDDAGRRTYTWKTRNLARDNNAPAPRDLPPPSVQITTFRTWDEVGRWYGELQQPQAAVTPAIRAKAAELTQGLSNDDDKLRALYAFVSSRIHYVSLSFGVGRYQPHAAADVLANEYGDCKDKHTLLAALLKAAGFDAWPTLINASAKVDPDLPSPAQFDHLITVVPRGNALVWLDTTPGVAPFSLLLPNLRDKQALVVATGRPAVLMKSPAVPPFASFQSFNIEGKLASDGTLTAHVQRQSRGDTEVFFRLGFQNVPAAQYKDLVQRISYASNFAGDVSSITASAPDDIAKPFEFAYDYTRKNYPDWENKRINAPLPPFGIEAGNEEAKKPTEPVLLGAPGEVSYQAKIELPSGFTATLPVRADLVQDFAEYHSSYAFEKGVLTVSRRLVIKKNEVPLTAWEDYRKFCEALGDDRDHWIELADVSTKSAQAHFEAERIIDQGMAAYHRGDFTAAQQALLRAVELEPSNPRAHANLGLTYYRQSRYEEALQEYRKDEELVPKDPWAYEASAQLLMSTQRYPEAIDAWRKLLNIDPKNGKAAAQLGLLLLMNRQYPEARDALETAVQLTPEDPTLRLPLSLTYLMTDAKDKAVAAILQAVTPESKANTLSLAARYLASAGARLDLAKEYAERAVRAMEKQSLKSSGDAGTMATWELADCWSILGRVYSSTGELEQAAKYLSAAWATRQYASDADLLAQVYERQGRERQAAHLYELALAATGGLRAKDRARQHYEHLTGMKPPDDVPALRRRNLSQYHPTVSAGEELSRARTFEFSTASSHSGSATFLITFTPGKVEDVQFVSGDEAMKSMMAAVKHTKFNLQFPDDRPVKLVRSGMTMCGPTGCYLVLAPAPPLPELYELP